LSIGRFNIEPRLPSFRNPLKRKLMTVRVENVKILILPHSQRASGAPKETQAAQKPQQQQRASSRSMAIDHPYAGIFVSILAAFTTLLVELVVDDVIIGVLPKVRLRGEKMYTEQKKKSSHPRFRSCSSTLTSGSSIPLLKASRATDSWLKSS